MASPLKKLYLYTDDPAWRRGVKLASAFSVINKFFDIMPEILIGMAIDIVIKREESFLAALGIRELSWQLYVLGFATLVIWVLESLTEYAAECRWRFLAQKAQHELRSDAVEHLQGLRLSWFESQNSGSTLAILNEDVNQVERFLNTGLHQVIQIAVSTLFIGVIFFYISPLVAFMAFTPVPLILFGAFYFRRHLGQRYSLVRERAGIVGARLAEVINGVVTIRAKVAEAERQTAVVAASGDYAAANNQAIRLSSAVIPIVRMAVLSGFLVTLILGGLQTLDGEMNPAAYTVLVFLTQRLLWPFTRLGEVVDLFERSLASLKRVWHLMAEPLEQPNKGQPLVEPVAGALSLSKVSFAYQPGRPVLRQVSLDIQPGEFVGIVGPTGSGKSSLIKLLLGFYEPDAGQIMVDRQDLSKLHKQSLRRHIGYVGQDVFLLDDTIRANLCLGLAGDQRTEAAMVAACQIAEIDEFIAGLPAGYDTRVGERGVKLSGGQRQRLAVARGLMGNPQILVLDEATSAVDNETEAAIQRSLEKAAKGRTMIVIAHRLSTVRHADRIYVLKDGGIVAAGRHEDLQCQPGLYRDLWRIQTGEPLAR